MVAKAKVRIEGEDATGAAWKSALGSANKAANNISKVWKTAFAGISVAAISRFVADSIELGDSLAKGAQKAGIAGKEFSTLAYAAKLADVEMVSLSTSIKKMQVNLSQAGSGGKAQVEALAALGLEIENIRDLAADEQFELLGDRISKLKDPADRARAATELFGKAGADLLPLFEQGAEGIRKAREEAEELGFAFNDEQLQRFEDADDALKRVGARWQVIGLTLAEKVIPAVEFMLDHMDEVATFNANTGRSLLGPFGLLIGGDEDEDAPRPKIPGRRGGGRGEGYIELPPGYSAGPDTAAAKADRERQAILRTAEQERIERERDEDAFQQKRLDNMYDFLEGHDKRLAEGVEDHFEHVGEAIDRLEIEVEESAINWQDSWESAFDAWLANGKHTVEELAKYMALQLASDFLTKGIYNLGSGSSSGAAAASSFFGSLLGGSMDSGGRGQRGKVYDIGVGAQPERFIPDSAGVFVPRGGRGGGTTVNQVNNYTVSGSAGKDEMRRIQKMQEESNRRLVDEMNRRHSLAGT